MFKQNSFVKYLTSFFVIPKTGVHSHHKQTQKRTIMELNDYIKSQGFKYTAKLLKSGVTKLKVTKSNGPGFFEQTILIPAKNLAALTLEYYILHSMRSINMTEEMQAVKN